MEIVIDDKLVERFKKCQERSIELGYCDYIPLEEEIEALLDKEVTKWERQIFP